MSMFHHGVILPLPEEPALPGENPKQLVYAWPFDYMFPELQANPDANLLPNNGTTVSDLQRLGREAMTDPGITIPGIPVPAVHTFLGQFIDHDITLERGSGQISLATATPLSPDQIKQMIVNSRSPNLDLDNVYGPDLDGQFSPRDPQDSNKMLIGKVSPSKGLPKGKDVWNDFPRLKNGKPLIGDPRDDQNLIIAQLHVAFLRAHNAIVERGFRFYEARKLLIQHYQWIVLDDFLPRIADANIVKMINFKGAKFFNPTARNFFMPLEFSLAAYRFGHSKVRHSYDQFNEIHGGGGLDQLFGFIHQQLPDDWVIQWPSFLDAENRGRFPRRIDTSLASKLIDIPKEQLGGQDPYQRNLAIRNMIRGYILRMPTGQAVARAMASQGILPMTPDDIKSVAKDIPVLGSTTKTQADTLEELETDFLNKTPLWFYILAEAAFYSRGYHLGPVGSTIVAEVLIGVLRNSTYSIMAEPGWRPTLGETPGKFDIEDLLKLAGVY